MIIDLRDCLRLHDNPLLQGVERPLLVWVCETLRWQRMSPRRRQFTHQALVDVRQQARALGGDLVILHGDRVEQLQALAKSTGLGIRVNASSGWDEREQDRLLGAQRFDASSLFYRQDLPFDEVPEPFTRFRNQVQKRVPIATPLPMPVRLAPLPAGVDAGELPQIQAVPTHPNGVMEFVGGEQAALKHLSHYLSDPRRPTTYKQTRNGLLGADYSTKFSPWLAQGSLSARQIWQAVTDFERDVQKNDSTYWIKFELLWREYFHWWVQSWGPRLYAPDPNARDYAPAWQAWSEANTGVPFIDANLRELIETGFMSNRGRQNVASFLAKDLRLDYRLGADFFEYHLLDYDHGSNWGNWAYVAGVGADPREDRWFNVMLQATRYDKAGRYVRHWLPHLEAVESSIVHWPWVGGVASQPIVAPAGWNKVIQG